MSEAREIASDLADGRADILAEAGNGLTMHVG